MNVKNINWQVLKDLKFEIIGWCLIHLSLFKLLVLLPFSANSYKDIFMGMNVTLPSSTILVLNYSSFITSYIIILLPLILCILALTWFLGIYLMHKITDSVSDKNSDKYIQLQFKILAGLLVIYLIISAVSSELSGALTTPMLRLVNTM